MNVDVCGHHKAGVDTLFTHLRQALPGANLSRVHGFPARGYSDTGVFVYRNPFDVLWDCWLLWSEGNSGNLRIRDALSGMSFSDYLDGKCGGVVGFSGVPYMGRQDMEETRGLLYDPVRYYFDHAREWLSVERLPRVAFEYFVTCPDEAIQGICHRLGRPPKTGDRGLAIATTRDVHTFERYSSRHVEKIMKVGRDILPQMGYWSVKTGLEYRSRR